MKHLKFSEILPYRASDLIGVVMNAYGYKDISSMIKDIQEDKKGDHVKEVAVTIEAPVLPAAFHYRCRLDNSHSGLVKAEALDSPFQKMEGVMTFTKLDGGYTQVDCDIAYETGSWLRHPLANIIAKIMESQIDQGIARAKIYLAQKLSPVSVKGPAIAAGRGPNP